MVIIMLGGGPNNDRLDFRYWNNPGAFAIYKDIPVNLLHFYQY